MKRLLPIGILVLAFIGVVGASPGMYAAGKSEACAKIRHSKTVWVTVKKNGKKVRVKRRKVWWTCDPYEAPGPPRLGVVAKEFKLTFSRPYVKAGRLILQLDNQGEDDHNLRIARKSGGSPIAEVGNTAPRQQTTVEVPIRPGTYRLWCALPGHAKFGMKATLKVVGPKG